MLKYGTNLLQAVGQFNGMLELKSFLFLMIVVLSCDPCLTVRFFEGHYIIAIAFMSVTSFPEPPVLLDYVQSCVTESDPGMPIRKKEE